MYKLFVFATILAVCSATVVLPTALHYVAAAPHSSAKVTKYEWEHHPVNYVVPAVAPVAPVVTYSHKTYVHSAAPVLHAAPLVHTAPIVHTAPVVHAAAPLFAAPVVHHSTTYLANKKA
ncbi:uncharacterized protein TNCT_556671 [Trichonephila clavata]|uniref:Uncharacterized protein n=1 Tax=Trichonephila clavata TaxID=2740835 RepID=A0A8X6LA52_TRICU|nr:uncharacterized protein TNCT_556671 [Trichonephila clavata]